MGSSKKTMTLVSISLIFALGVGVAIGVSIKNKKQDGVAGNAAVTPGSDINFSDKSVEDLGSMLSEVMLPEEEFKKLEAAIFQTAMGLFMAQAQGAQVTVTEDAQQELKKSIDEKYSRKYFSDINATSMKELSKEELISILGFYHTAAGKKFLELSPKIIQQTMSTVQADLSSWLPKTVDALVAKLKGGNKEEAPAAPKGDLKKPEPAKDDKENS